jgi:carboxyl-terminal processing protease
VTPKNPSRIALTLYAKNHIFDFATKYKQDHDSIATAQAFTITDKTYDSFLAYLEGKDFEYTTETEKALENLKEKAQAEEYYQFIEKHLGQLKEDLENHKSNDLITFQNDIKDFLRNEIITRNYYQRGAIEGSLKDDKQVKKAIEILADQDTYHSILQGTYKDTDK